VVAIRPVADHHVERGGRRSLLDEAAHAEAGGGQMAAPPSNSDNKLSNFDNKLHRKSFHLMMNTPAILSAFKFYNYI